ncbi:hypothetical protein L596_026946 [Steinernema carpocapsae]|uniref:Uncharacterized protein n=1 Tax=Steinernema carpocapsae TaxID=34508 RepID=A0A4V6XVQ1_STECR|nr:hypothetical protein L596_026946 [Steinernema carpocapsae]
MCLSQEIRCDLHKWWLWGKMQKSDVPLKTEVCLSSSQPEAMSSTGTRRVRTSSLHYGKNLTFTGCRFCIDEVGRDQ